MGIVRKGTHLAKNDKVKLDASSVLAVALCVVLAKRMWSAALVKAASFPLP